MRWIFFLFSLFSLAAKQLEVNITAKSAILMNAESGEILFEKHAHIPSYPASTTKVATALYLLGQKKLPLNQMVTVSEDAVKLRPPDSKEGEYPPYWNRMDGTKMGIRKGEILPVESLLHGLMLVSGNDAANALAEAACGSVPGFMEELNEYLMSLGCKNTRFVNPHGFHHSEHLTTAYDLALITKEALRIPEFRQIVSSPTYKKPKTNKQAAGEIASFNALLEGGRHHYPKAIGIKTGYNIPAGYTIVAAAEHEGRTLIAVLLGCPNKNIRYIEATRLFETAFAEQKKNRPFFGISHLFTREIPGAKTPLHAHLAAPLTLAFYPAEEPNCKAFVHWNHDTLPIRKGQKVGEIHIKNDKGTLLQKGDIVAVEKVESTFWSKVQGWFGQKSGASR